MHDTRFLRVDYFFPYLLLSDRLTTKNWFEFYQVFLDFAFRSAGDQLTAMSTAHRRDLVSMREKGYLVAAVCHEALAELFGVKPLYIERVLKSFEEIGILQRFRIAGLHFYVIGERHKCEDGKVRPFSYLEILVLHMVSHLENQSVQTYGAKEDTQDPKVPINAMGYEERRKIVDEFWALFPSKRDKLLLTRNPPEVHSRMLPEKMVPSPKPYVAHLATESKAFVPEFSPSRYALKVETDQVVSDHVVAKEGVVTRFSQQGSVMPIVFPNTKLVESGDHSLYGKKIGKKDIEAGASMEPSASLPALSFTSGGSSKFEAGEKRSPASNEEKENFEISKNAPAASSAASDSLSATTPHPAPKNASTGQTRSRRDPSFPKGRSLVGFYPGPVPEGVDPRRWTVDEAFRQIFDRWARLPKVWGVDSFGNRLPNRFTENCHETAVSTHTSGRAKLGAIFDGKSLRGRKTVDVAAAPARGRPTGSTSSKIPASNGDRPASNPIQVAERLTQKLQDESDARILRRKQSKAESGQKVHYKMAEYASFQGPFHAALAKTLPGITFPAWGPKELKLVKDLIERDGVDPKLLRLSLIYFATMWSHINRRAFKGGASIPTIGMFFSMFTQMCAEAQIWNNFKQIQEEMAKYQPDVSNMTEMEAVHARFLYNGPQPPAELQALYDQALVLYKNLGGVP